MNVFLLLTDAAETVTKTAETSGELLFNYLIYAVIIAVGIVVLLLLKKATRLPSHTDVKEKVSAFSAALTATETDAPDRLVERLNRANKLVGDCDKLIYTTSAIAQKERDSDMDSVCTLLEGARGELVSFRNNGGSEGWRIAEARTRTESCLALLENILERDKALKKNKKRT